MAIIYTYPTKAIPNTNDLVLISDSQDSNKTKQVTIGSLPGNAGSGVTSVTSANAAITVADPTTTPVLTSVAYSGGSNIGHVPTGGSANTFLKGNGSFSAVNVATDVSGILAVENGGTGKNIYTTGDILYAASAGSFGGVAIGTAGQVLKVNSSANAPEWVTETNTTYVAGDGIDIDTSTNPDTIKTDLKANGGLVIESTELAVDLAASSITGTLATDDGGTGQTTYSVGDILYRGGVTGQLAKLSIGTAGKSLTVNSGGTAPEWIDNSYSIGADTKVGSSVPLKLDFGGGASGDSTVNLTDGSGIDITRTSSTDIKISNAASGFSLLQPYASSTSQALTLAGNTFTRIAVSPTKAIISKATIWLTQGNSNVIDIGVYDSSTGSSISGDLLGQGTLTINFASSFSITAGQFLTILLTNQSNSNTLRLLGGVGLSDTIVGYTLGEAQTSGNLPSDLSGATGTAAASSVIFAMVLH